MEPLVPAGIAVHGALVLLSGDGVQPWQVVALGGTALLAALGLFGLDQRPLVALRAVAALVAPWAFVAPTGGAGTVITLWFAAAVLVYPVSLRPVAAAVAYPLLAAGSYLGLATTAGSAISSAEVATRAALLLGAGYVVWLLGAASARLAGERETAQTEARRAQGRFVAAFANASTGMAMIGLDGAVLQANRALAELMQRAAEELQSVPWIELFHPDDRRRVQERMEALVAGDVGGFQEEVRCLRADRGVAWGFMGASLVRDDDGHPLQVFAHVQDLTERMAAEQQLQASEEHYRNLFGRSPVAIWELDYGEVGAWLHGLRLEGVEDLRTYLRLRPDLVLDGIGSIGVVAVNDSAVALVEAENELDLLRGIPEAMLTDEMVEAFVDQFVAVWEGKDRVETGVATRSLHGRRIDVILHWVAPVIDGRLELAKVAVAFADITEYRRTQEALRRIEERLRTVVGAAPIVLFALDHHGVFTLSEGEGLAALGLGPGQAVGRSIFELFRNAPQLIGSVRRALAGEAFTTSVEIDSLHFDTRFTPIWGDGRVTGVIGVANDITERKRASERLEQLIRSKDEFVASVSHELRTPLTAVVGFAQELRSNMDGFGEEEVEMFIELIAEQSMEVADLVEDLLVAARVDIDKVAVSPEPLNVRDQVEMVLAAWPPDKSDKVSVGGEENPKAYADPIRLRQIVRNLLTNAHRYGGDRIEVWFTVDRDVVSIEVRDNGPGIPERDREKIFEPYHRAHRFEGQPASVGLGLTVSRQLARLMGGELSYRYLGDQSVFELTLPGLD